MARHLGAIVTVMSYRPCIGAARPWAGTVAASSGASILEGEHSAMKRAQSKHVGARRG